MYESNDVGADDAPQSDEQSIDDESRAQADGATVPYPSPARPPARAPHTHHAQGAHDNWEGRTPW